MATKSSKTGSKKQTKAAKGSKAKAAKADGKLSALDAAAAVLKKRGEAMRSQEMISAMADQGLWTSPNGKTPHATCTRRSCAR